MQILKIIVRTAKIAITTEGLGITEAFLSRSISCDTNLEKFCILGENIETRLQHFKKKDLKRFISYKYTWDFELNEIDFKITKNYKKLDIMPVSGYMQ